MAKLVYTMLASLDGYIADEDGNFDWAAPDEEIHSFVNENERRVGTYLYGRRMYDVMRYWETAHADKSQPPYILDYAQIWQSADKVVYSRTLRAPSTARTRIEREFTPAVIREMKAAADRDISIGGPHLAAEALTAGLVDEMHVYLVPYVAGGGTQFLPDGLRLPLDLLDERRFASGAVHLRFSIRND